MPGRVNCCVQYFNMHARTVEQKYYTFKEIKQVYTSTTEDIDELVIDVIRR